MQCVDTNEDCESMLSTNILQLFLFNNHSRHESLLPSYKYKGLDSLRVPQVLKVPLAALTSSYYPLHGEIMQVQLL